VGRDALNAFTQKVSRRHVADIAEAEHADHPFLLVDRRQPADLQLFHVPDRLGEIFVFSRG
jgi:hypothetical protein